jgi:hypothetical protein
LESVIILKKLVEITPSQQSPSTKLSAFYHQISPLYNNIEFLASKSFKKFNPETNAMTLFSAVACGENIVLSGSFGG